MGLGLSVQMKLAKNLDSKTEKVKSFIKNRNETKIPVGHFLGHPVVSHILGRWEELAKFSFVRSNSNALNHLDLKVKYQCDIPLKSPVCLSLIGTGVSFWVNFFGEICSNTVYKLRK